MRIIQSTIERLAWWIVFLILLINVVTFIKLTSDDNRKFRILRNNQNTLICIVKGFAAHESSPDFIDNCVRKNQ